MSLKFITGEMLKDVTYYDDAQYLQEGQLYLVNGFDFPVEFKGLCKKDDIVNSGIYILEDTGDAYVHINKSEPIPEGQLIDLSDEDDILELARQHPELTDNYLGVTVEELARSSGSSEIYAPAMVEDDNILARALKKAFAAKNAPLKVYEGRFQSATDRGNHKKSLESGNLSINRFMSFLEKFDLDVEIIIRDSDADTPFPMGEEIIERS